MAKPLLAIQVQGGDEVKRMLRELPRSVYLRAERRAAAIAMKPVLKSMKKRAPRDTGALRKSLVVKSKAYIRKSKVFVAVGANYEYMRGKRRPANYLHLTNLDVKPHAVGKGSVRIIRSKKAVARGEQSVQQGRIHPGTTGKHYVERSLAENHGNVVTIYKARIVDAIRIEMQKYRRREAAKNASR